MQKLSKIFGIISLILIFMAFFMVNVPLKPELSFISGIFIILMALPSYYALYKWLGVKKAVLILLILSLYAFSIETLAIITGFPYSSFHYTELIGFKVGGYTPYTVPFAYVPIFIGSIYISSILTKNIYKFLIITSFLVLLVDLMLDPAAVALNFWIYESSGIFYGVPLMNFIGWIISGFIASLITIPLLEYEIFKDKPKALVSSLFFILSFWFAVCFYLGLIIPGLIGFILLFIILWLTRLDTGNYNCNIKK